MAERGHGGIINVSSVAAFLPRGTYSAAKAWVNSFSEWAANEYRPRGVTVMALCPGFTRTEFHERMDVDRGSAPDFMWLDADDLVASCPVGLRQGPDLLDPVPRSTRRSRPPRGWSRPACCSASSRSGASSRQRSSRPEGPRGRSPAPTASGAPASGAGRRPAAAAVQQPVVLLRGGGVAAELVVDLAGAVVVAGAGDHQVEVARDRAQPLAGRGVVVLVVDLDAGQPELGAARRAPPRRARVVVPCRPHGCATRSRRRPSATMPIIVSSVGGVAVDVRRPPGAEEAVERLVAVGHHAQRDQRVGDVRAAGRRGLAGDAGARRARRCRCRSPRSRSSIAGSRELRPSRIRRSSAASGGYVGSGR